MNFMIDFGYELFRLLWCSFFFLIQQFVVLLSFRVLDKLLLHLLRLPFSLISLRHARSHQLISRNSIDGGNIGWCENNFCPETALRSAFPRVSFPPAFPPIASISSEQTKLLLTANIRDCLSINIWFFPPCCLSSLLSCLCIAFIVMQSTLICLGFGYDE